MLREQRLFSIRGPFAFCLGERVPFSAPIHSPPRHDRRQILVPAQHRRSFSPGGVSGRGQQVAIDDVFTEPAAFRMAFLGTGQGGGKIANSFWKLGYRRVGIFNTTENDFDGIDEEIPKLSLNIGGARKDMQLARASLAGREEEVWELMLRGCWRPWRLTGTTPPRSRRAASSTCGSSSDARHAAMPNANSLTVLSPFTAANATCALNVAVWDFRFLAMITPFLDGP